MCKRIFADQTAQIGDIPFYKIGTLGLEPDCYISRELFQQYKMKYNFPEKDETLITCSGTVGKCVQFDGKDAYFQDSNIVWLHGEKTPISNDFLYWILTKKDWSSVNTTTISRIYTSNLLDLKVVFPTNLEEQNKITQLLFKIEERISTQNKIIRDLKVLIKRFLDFDHKTSTSEYKNVLLSSILTESKILNSNNNDIYSVAVEDGVVNQVEHLGRSFAAKDTSNYHVAKYGDIIYTKSPTGSFPYGIIKQSFVQNDVAVSPLYGIYHPNSYEIGYYIHHYFLYAINCNNYLHPLVNKGAKNTMNITNTRFLEGKILVPKNTDRVNSIFKFLNAINKKLNNEIKISNKLLEQKNFLLKNLFI